MLQLRAAAFAADNVWIYWHIKGRGVPWSEVL